eukprot:gene12673-6569_t
MLQNYYVVSTCSDKTFKDLHIGKNETERAHQYLILMFDFSGIDTTSFEKFEISLNDKLNTSMEAFQDMYQNELKPFKINENNSIDTFQRLMNSVSISKENLYILVDEYDASINEALGNIDLVKGLQKKQTEESKGKMTKIESKFKQIFSNFKEASEKKGAYVFVTGFTPLA